MWLHGANRALMRRTLRGQPQINLFHHDFSVCDRYAGGMDAAERVSCPVHFVLGSADQMTSPKATREIADALKAKIHLLPCGHSMMIEQPGAMQDVLEQALA
jgi:pimeloyl-ACP methyl ester carboxylesterase